MTIQMFSPQFYPGRGRSGMRPTVVLLAVAAVGYVAGALLHGSLPPSNDSAAFARPVQAAEAHSGGALPAAAPLATMPRADDSRWSDAEWIANPRECDVGKGIATACVFMD